MMQVRLPACRDREQEHDEKRTQKRDEHFDEAFSHFSDDNVTRGVAILILCCPKLFLPAECRVCA